MSNGAGQAAYALTEGDVDRVVVERWLGGTGYDVLPKRGSTGARGKSAAVQNLHALLTQRLTRLVVALDVNGGSVDELRDFISKTLRATCTADEKLQLTVEGDEISLSEGRARILPVGLLSDAHLSALGVTHHSIEDYLIVALHDDSCLSGFAKAERKNVRIPPNMNAAVLWADLAARLSDARMKGYVLNSSKDVLHLFCALVGFPARFSTLAERLLEVSAGTPAEALFQLPAGFVAP